ncbi:AbrB/MazE/SpoVT family DNA-binding domain-containing protein [Paenibacillus terrae]|uniref:AbrB/MazE/SpoVT family DNA-binding domain-containing protein n=1 Tax=Paenibacillus terrae TaxID=159743 RepID=UPI0005CBD142|nr:AbrB/MazE/SpoVT family DNA-binding domain-containing protein [Paenibacillus terrae]
MNKSVLVRYIDSLGRIGIPAGIRERLNITNGDSVEVIFEEGSIMIQRYTGETCLICRETEDISPFKNFFICAKCKHELTANSTSDKSLTDNNTKV